MEESPLALLPSELRDEIYDYIVYKPDVIWVVERMTYHTSFHDLTPHRDHKLVHEPLLDICRQMSNEAYERFLAVNTFSIVGKVKKVHQVLSLFLDTVGDQIGALRSLNLTFQDGSGWDDSIGVGYLGKVFIPTIKRIGDTCSRAAACNFRGKAWFRSKEKWPPDDSGIVWPHGIQFNLDIDIRGFKEQWKDVKALARAVSYLDRESVAFGEVAKECWTRLYERRLPEPLQLNDWVPQPPSLLFVVAEQHLEQHKSRIYGHRRRVKAIRNP